MTALLFSKHILRPEQTTLGEKEGNEKDIGREGTFQVENLIINIIDGCVYVCVCVCAYV
jgi:hypothetical protein